MSTAGTMPPISTTTIDDWRPFLERRMALRRRVEIPIELRLILMTTAIVVALVVTGAQVASAIHSQQALAASPGIATTSTLSATDLWQPDGICYPASTVARMISVQELASPYSPGIREVQPNVYRRCQVSGLPIPEPLVGAPSLPGQVILVSLSQQWLWAYQDGALVFANPVATGMRYLRTPLGDFHIQYKRADTTFYSPWPRSSPFYYSPEHINYAMFFRDIGYYIHDAPWRHAFGPGTQVPHTNPDGTWETGSHGCINMPTPAAAALYAWAGVGARIIIVA